jgi:protein arginine kinase activator
MHKGTRHVGKVPQTALRNRDLADRLKLLRKKLDKAVADEDFEQAARLRDEIKQVNGRQGSLAST